MFSILCPGGAKEGGCSWQHGIFWTIIGLLSAAKLGYLQNGCKKPKGGKIRLEDISDEEADEETKKRRMAMTWTRGIDKKSGKTKVQWDLIAKSKKKKAVG
jgi:hypothetical protein